MFYAYHREEYLTAGEFLDAVLAFVADCADPAFNEDAVVWQGGRVVAVCRAGGTVVRFDNPPAPPGADAVVDEAAGVGPAPS